jgi:hypothetical protein
MQKDRTLINQLAPLNMDDTLMEAGAEVLDQANIFYASVQKAIKADIPNAKPVLEDLKVRYEKQSKSRGGDPAAA